MPAPENPAAVEARKRGTIALNTGHYEDAIKAFEEAYALEQDPTSLFHLAQSYRLAGQPAKALEACSSFLRSRSASDTDRAQAERFLAEVEMIVYEIRLQRDQAPASVPAPESASKVPPPAVEPPPIASAKEPSDATPRPALDLKPRLAVAESSNLIASAAPASAKSGKPFYRHTAFWVVAGTAVAAGAVLIWLGERSSGLKAPNTALGYQQAFP